MPRVLCIILFLFPAFSFCQTADDGIIRFNAKDYKLSAKEELDPAFLVAALTQGKTSEEEKFQAIFGWVVTNLRYNYRQYYSTGGSYYLSTKEILRRRNVVCLGYANLMDSLCHIAGIVNTTVYGFATDEIFDVHDSVSTDNHAWNAVKLDGLWYLYDVTWSSGTVEYKLTRFGKFIERMQKKFPPKYRQIEIKPRGRRFLRDCPSTFTGTASYLKQKYFNRLWIRFLHRFRPKYRKTYVHKIRSDYYLCQPELFSITHCPADPIWSLGTLKNILAFENDSAYYYHNDSIYKTQERSGRECPACDALLELGAKEKHKTSEKNIYASNNKNRFAVFEHEYNSGKINYKEALAEPLDSVKLEYLDSAQFNFLNAKKYLKAHKSNNAYDIMLQKRKNKKKMGLLLFENRGHRNIIRKRIRLSMYYTQSFRRMETKSEAFARRWRGKAEAIGYIRTDFKTYPARKGGEMKAARKQLKLDKTKAEIDTLIRHTNLLEARFDSLVQVISLNIWSRAKQFDTLAYFFGKRIGLRYKRLDNYKKPVEDTRIKIVVKEFNLNNDLDFLVYQPALKAAALYRSILKWTERRQKLQRKCLSYERDLVKIEKNPMSSLEEFKSEVLFTLRNDYCWLETALPYIISANMGFDFLRWKQKEVDLIIPIENKVEKDRAYYINEVLKGRYHKHNHIAEHNLWLTGKMLREIKNYRKKITRKRK